MRSSAIIVANPFTKNLLQMTFAEWNQEVQAFSPNRADQPFTERVRFGCPDWRFQNTNAETIQSHIQTGREDGVAVVDNVAVRVIECQELAELLRSQRF